LRSALSEIEARDMNWTGKVLGAALGALAGGPVGAVFGAVVGHQFDRGVREAGPPPKDVQEAFFKTTFSVMGHIAKADGRVSEDEIRAARAIMHHMRLSPEQVQTAIGLFTEGKRPDFPVEARIDELSRVLGRRRDLIRAFLEIQVQAVLGAGEIHAAAREVLWRVASGLGASRVELAQIEALIRLQKMRARQTGGQPMAPAPIEDAYRVLGVTADATDRDVKTAYRRLMNQHHPDKLRARGMPESMIPVAEEKTREIRAAYDRVRTVRGMR
jgi:DnaJ like chaperone protein